MVLRQVAKWLVPAPAGVLTGWAAAATAGAPEPAEWTLAGIAEWCATPFNSACVVVGVVAGIASFLGLRSWLEGARGSPATGEDMKAVLEKLSALEARLAADPEVSERVASDFAATARELAQSSDPAEREAGAQIAAGKPVEAADRLMKAVGAEKVRTAGRARQAARIYAPFDVERAKAAYGVALDLDPSDATTWIELSRLHSKSGALAEARRCAERALQVAALPADRISAHNLLGDLATARGDTAAAERCFEAASGLAEQLIEKEPENSTAWIQHAFALTKLGDVAAASGRRDRAAAHYDHARQLFAKLADFGVCNDEGILLAEARLATLCADHPAGHPLSEARKLLDGFKALVESKGDDPLSLHNVAVAHLMCAAAALKESRLEETERLCAEALGFIRRWRRIEPTNPDVDRLWAAIETKLGDLAIRRSAGADALAHYEGAHRVMAAAPPAIRGHAHWQHDLAVSLERLGDAQSSLGNPKAALRRYSASLRILKRLAARDPANAEWQRCIFNMRRRQWREALRHRPRTAFLIHGFRACNLAGALSDRFPGDPRIPQDIAEFREELAQAYGSGFSERIFGKDEGAAADGPAPVASPAVGA
jgi:tetratricopeptide (TPR) repeat protein